MESYYSYYCDSYGGTMAEEIIVPLLEKAADIIGGMIYEKEYSKRESEAIAKAVCIEAEELAATGNGGYSSLRLGDFAVSGNASKTSVICTRALAVLDREGLFYRGGIGL